VSVVVELSRYRSKGVLTTARELFVWASKGQLAGLRFQAVLKDGRRKEGAAGKAVEDAQDVCACAGKCSLRSRP
jgi:hypothetical protein